MCRINAIKIGGLPMQGVKYHKLSLDEFPEFKEKYNIKLVPSMLFFKGGEEIGRIEGDLADDLLGEVKEQVARILKG